MLLCRPCARKLLGLRKHYSSVANSRDYNAAVHALNGLQSNSSIVETLRKLGPGWNKHAIPDMINWLKMIGYEVCVVV